MLVGNQEELAHLMAGYKKDEEAAVALAPAPNLPTPASTTGGRKKREIA